MGESPERLAGYSIKGILVLLILALGLRLGWGLTRPADDTYLSRLPDQLEYRQIANNFLDGRGLTMFDESFNDTTYAYRMPGYPLLIAACGAKLPVVRGVQALLDTSSVLAVWLMCVHWRMSRGAALLAAALVALNPYLIYFSATILSETLFTSMLAWGMYVMSRPGRLAFGIGAIVLVLSIYVRPGAIGLPLLLGMASPLVRQVAPVRSFWRVPAGMAMVLIMVVCLVPWAMRNHARLGKWVVTTTNSGITAYDGLNPHADGSSNQAAFRSWPDLKTMSETERSAYLGALARQWATQHPAQALRLAGKKIARTWSPLPLSAEYGSNPLYIAVGAVFAVPMFLLVGWGLWAGTVSRSIKLYLMLPALYFTMVHAITIGSLRYRVPADVPMSVIAAAGAAGWLARAKPVAPVVEA